MLSNSDRRKVPSPPPSVSLSISIDGSRGFNPDGSNFELLWLFRLLQARRIGVSTFAEEPQVSGRCCFSRGVAGWHTPRTGRISPSSSFFWEARTRRYRSTVYPGCIAVSDGFFAPFRESRFLPLTWPPDELLMMHLNSFWMRRHGILGRRIAALCTLHRERDEGWDTLDRVRPRNGISRVFFGGSPRPLWLSAPVIVSTWLRRKMRHSSCWKR